MWRDRWWAVGAGGQRPEGEPGQGAAAAAMQEIIASVDHIKFDLEIAVEQQLGAQPLPFPGMDSERGAPAGGRARPARTRDSASRALSPHVGPLSLARTREPLPRTLDRLGLFVISFRAAGLCRLSP